MPKRNARLCKPYVKVFDFKPVRRPRVAREILGIKQDAFWAMLGVSQSTGSRYETGRQMPPQVAQLLRQLPGRLIMLGAYRDKPDMIERATKLSSWLMGDKSSQRAKAPRRRKAPHHK